MTKVSVVETKPPRNAPIVEPPTQSAPPLREGLPQGRWALAHYRVRLHVDRLVGGIPKNPELIKAWLIGRGVTLGVETLAKEEAAKLPPEDENTIIEGAWKGFFKDEMGLFIEPRNIRGMLKQSARAIPEGGTKTVKAALKKLTDNLAIAPSRIRMGRSGKYLTEPDGCEERAVHVMTPKGPRTALKRSDYVLNVEVEFTMSPSHPDLTEAWLKDLVEYASVYLGLGSDVSQEEGKFRLKDWEKL